MLKHRLRVLIDTNVAYIFLTEREDRFSDEVYEIMRLCVEKKIYGYLAFHSLSTIWYLCRKLTDKERRRVILGLCNILTIVGTGQD